MGVSSCVFQHCVLSYQRIIVKELSFIHCVMEKHTSLADYDIVCKIGKGAFHYVHKAIHRPTQRYVALKSAIDDNDETDDLIHEVAVLNEIGSHPNIVTLYSIVSGHQDPKQCTVFELVPTTLYEMGKISLSRSRQYLRQILCALARCHAAKILHCDVKPENILIHSNHLVKLADFASSILYLPGRDHKTASNMVTLWYRAPELLLGTTRPTPALDVWSAGCTFAHSLIGQSLFGSTSEKDLIEEIFYMLGSPTEKSWPGVTELTKTNLGKYKYSRRDLWYKVPALNDTALDLLERMLTLDPLQRISASDAMRHPFFAER